MQQEEGKTNQRGVRRVGLLVLSATLLIVALFAVFAPILNGGTKSLFSVITANFDDTNAPEGDSGALGGDETGVQPFNDTEAAPKLVSITPNRGPANGGQDVTITGEGFTSRGSGVVSAGGSHTLAVNHDGKVYAWGLNTNGQLGNGTNESSALPVAVDTSGALAGKTIVKVSAGGGHSLAVDSDGKVYAWGLNESGQLGDNTLVSKNVPVYIGDMGVLNGKEVVSVSAGNLHSLALDSNGLVHSWGRGNFGQLGRNSNLDSRVPVSVYSGGTVRGKKTEAIVAGYNFSLSLDVDGKVSSWGLNGNGQLGIGSKSNTNIPTEVRASAGPLAGKRVVGIGAGNTYAVVVDSNGKMYSWGYGSGGRLGLGNSSLESNIPVATLVPDGVSGGGIVSISVGLDHTLAVDSDGKLYGWGRGNYGQLGSGVVGSSDRPVLIDSVNLGQGIDLVSFSAGSDHSVMTGSNGLVYSLGSNSHGQLGNGLLGGESYTLERARVALSEVPAVSLGESSLGRVSVMSPTTLEARTAPHAAGFVDANYSDFNGQASAIAGVYEYVAAPFLNSVLPGRVYVTGGDVITLSGHSFSEDALVKIGGIDAEIISQTSTTITVATPVNVPGKYDVTVVGEFDQRSTIKGGLTYEELPPVLTGITPSRGPATGGQPVTVTGDNFLPTKNKFKSVFAGETHSMAVDYDNKVYGWGRNNYGQLATGDSYTRSEIPVPVGLGGALEGLDIVQIASGGDHVLVLASDKRVYSWGYNSNGQLGNNSVVQSVEPVAVGSGSVMEGKDIVAVSASSNHSLALGADGSIYAWGYNASNQLGDGSVVRRTLPVKVVDTDVLLGKKITDVAAGSGYSLALDEDGLVYGWGANNSGQLGDNTYTQRATPVASLLAGPLAGKAVASIHTGQGYSFALDHEGTLYGWGLNSSGQLGDNTIINRAAPVVVSSSGALVGKKVTAVSAYGVHSLAVDSEGVVYAWGTGTVGRLGTGTVASSRVPVAVNIDSALAGSKVVDVSAGSSHSTAVDDRGNVYAWGSNTYGQLGDNSVTQRNTAVNVAAVRYASPSLTLGGQVMLNKTLKSSAEVVAITPPGEAGLTSLSVVNYDDQTAILEDTYEYVAAPQIEAVSPGAVYVTGGDTVTVSGQYFEDGLIVKINNVEAEVISLNSTTVVVKAPVGAAGLYDVTVTDVFGQSVTLEKSLRYSELPPVLSGVSPDRGPAEGGQSVTITGDNFVPGDNIFSYISANNGYSFAIDSQGWVYGWGSGIAGVGAAPGTENNYTPISTDRSGVLSGKKIVKVSRGTNHTLVLDSDGKLYGWGTNTSGQLGNKSNSNATLPVAVDMTGVLAGKRVVDISAGSSYSVALDSDGGVYSWGINTSSQLGDGSTANSNVPIYIGDKGMLAGKRVESVASGNNFVLALDSDGKVYSWGVNSSGQLGDGSQVGSSLPATVDMTGVLNGKKVVAVAGGSSHSVALDSDGKVYSWGYNNSGQLGDGSSAQRLSPVEVRGGAIAGVQVESIMTSSSSTYAVDVNGKVYGWGSNNNGQLGVGSVSSRVALPVAVVDSGVLLGKRIVQVSSGSSHAVALDDEGALYSWGYNGNGQLGNGPGVDSTVPVKVAPVTDRSPDVLIGGDLLKHRALVSPITVVATTPAYTPGIYDLTVTNYDGQTASLSGRYEYVAAPVLTSVSPSTVYKTGGDVVTLSGHSFSGELLVEFGDLEADIISQTENTIIARAPAGNVGAYDVSVTDEFGQVSVLKSALNYIELPPTLNSILPTRGPAGSGQDVSIEGSGFITRPGLMSISSSDSNTLAVDYSGKVYGWGQGGSGQLGNGTKVSSSVPVPVDVTGVLAGKKITSVSAGLSHSLAVGSDGSVYSWGSGTYGVLGEGSFGARLSPIDISGFGHLPGKNIVAVSAGADHSLALDSDGSVYSWGRNNNGQLGNGSVLNAPTIPTQITTGAIFGKKIVAISAGHYYSIALDSEGFVYGWGLNGSSQLGDGSVTRRDSAVRLNTFGVSPKPSAVGISAGRTHALAVDSSGKVYSWGTGNALGAGSITISRNPIAVDASGVLAGKKIVSVSAGLGHSAALDSEGRVYAWGSASNGALGNGQSTGTSTAPVAVLSGEGMHSQRIVAVSTGGNYSIAVDSNGSVYGWGANQAGYLGNGLAGSELEPVHTGVVLSELPLISLGGVDLTDIRVLSPTSAVGKTSPREAGVVDLTYVNYDSQTVTLNDAYEYIAGPVISAVSPNKGYVNGGDSVTISGANFSQGSTVKIGDVEAGVISITGNTIVINTPSSNAGIYDVTVTDPLGQVFTLPQAFTYQELPPVLTGILPNRGPAKGGQDVTISGQGFVPDESGFKLVSAGPRHSLALDSDGKVYSWGYNGWGQLGDNSTTQRNAPVEVFATGALAGKSIVGVAVGGTHSLAIDSAGKAYHWGASGGKVPIEVVATGALSGKNIIGGSTGTHSLVVDSDGKVYSWGANSFGQLGDGSTTGQFNPVNVSSVFGAAPKVLLGGLPLGNKRLASSTTITGRAPAHSPGLADLTVTNYDGQTVTLEGAYEFVAPPEIISVTPNSGSVAGGQYVYVSGDNFTSQSKVRFGSTEATTSYVNKTTLLVQVPVSVNPGEVDVTVYDEFEQEATIAGGYIYQLPAPNLTSVSPRYVKMSGESTVTITGSGFVQRQGGGSWYDVTVGSAKATNVIYVNTTTLRATVPANTPGAVSVTVGGDYVESAALNDSLTYLPQSYKFTNEPRNVMATQPAEFTVQALDQNGNPVVAGDDITLNLTSSSSAGFFARALTGSEAGWGIGTAIIPAGSDSATFYYRDSNSGTPTITTKDALNEAASQQLTISSRFSLLVTGVSNPAQMGVPSSVTVQAVDYTGAPQADFRGTIKFSSDDKAAVLPADYTFTSADHGRKTFVNGVTMGTMGVWDVIVTHADDAAITGTQEGVIVEAPASGTISQFKFITPSQSFPLDETSGVMTVQTQDASGNGIPVSSNTAAYLRSSSSTGMFSIDGGKSWQQAPLQITINQNTSHKNFMYKDATAGVHQLKVSSQESGDFGWQVAVQSVVVGVGAPSKFGIEAPLGAAIGQWVPVDVQVTDDSGNPVTAPHDVAARVSVVGDSKISLVDDGSDEGIEKEVFITAGQQSVTVYVQARSGNKLTINVHDSRGDDFEGAFGSATKDIPLGDASASGLVFADLPEQTVVHTATPSHISLRDQFGNIVSAEESVEITLSGDKSDTTFATSKDGSAWQPTQKVTISAGATTASAYLKNTNVTDSLAIGASASDLDEAISNIRVIADVYAGKVGFEAVSQGTITAGSEQEFTAVPLDAYGNKTTAPSAIEVGFGVNPNASATWNGVVAVNATAPEQGVNVTIPTGQSAATATFRATKTGSYELQAYDQSLWNRDCKKYQYLNGPCIEWSSWYNSSVAVHAVAVKADAPAAYAVATDPVVVSKNVVSSPITIELRDQFGNASSFDSVSRAAISTTGAGAGFDVVGGSSFNLSEIEFTANQSTSIVVYKSSIASSSQGDMFTVSGGGLQPASQSIRVVEGFAEQAVVDTAGASTVVAGYIIPVTLRSQTSEGQEVVVLKDTPLDLVSGEGEFSLTETPFVPLESVTLRAESSQQQLFYRSNVAGIVQIGAGSGVLEYVSTEIAVLSNTFYSLGYTALPIDNRVQATKGSDAFVVTAYDEYGNVATPSEAGSTHVGVSSSKSAGQFKDDGSDWGVTTVSIATGATTSVPFYYKIGSLNQDSSALTDPSVLGVQTITSSYGGVESAAVDIDVVGEVARSMAFVTDQQVIEAGVPSEKISIQLRGATGQPAIASNDQVIQISSVNLSDYNLFAGSNGADVYSETPDGSEINSVTVKAGSSVVEFYVTAKTAESHRIQARSSLPGFDGQNTVVATVHQRLDVLAAKANKFKFMTTEQTIHPDIMSEPIKVVLTDEFGNPAVNSQNRTLNLSSTCGTGSFFVTTGGQSVSSLELVAGANEAIFYYKDTQASSGSCGITVSSAGLGEGVQDIVVREPVYGLVITSQQQTIEAGQTSESIAVEARDRFGNIVTAEKYIPVSLKASSGKHTITPLSVTMQPGESSVQFKYRHDVAVVGFEDVTLTAEVHLSDEVVPDQQTIRVTEGKEAGLQFSTDRFKAVAGDYEPMTVQVLNGYGKRTVTSKQLVASLSSQSEDGAFYKRAGDTYEQISSVNIAAGTGVSSTIYYRQIKTTQTKLQSTIRDNPVAITASFDNFSQVKSLVTIEAKQLAFSAGSFSAQASAYMPIKVSLSSTLNEDLQVSLGGNPATGGFYTGQSEDTLVDSTVIKAGELQSQQLYYRQTTVTGSTSVYLSATAVGAEVSVWSARSRVGIYVSQFSQLEFIQAPTELAQGQDGTFTVEARDSLGNVVPFTTSYGVYCLYVGDGGSGGAVQADSSNCDSASGKSGIAIGRLQTRATFKYSSGSIGSVDVSVSSSSGSGGIKASTSVNITAAQTTGVAFDRTSYGMLRGDELELAVSLVSNHGFKVNTVGESSVQLSSDSATGRFYDATSDSWKAAVTLSFENGQSTVSGVRYSDTSTQDAIQLIADAQNLSSGSARVSLGIGSFGGMIFKDSPTQLERGQTGALTVSFVDEFNNVTPVLRDTCLYIKTAGVAAELSGNTDESCQDKTLPDGSVVKAILALAGETSTQLTYKSMIAGEGGVIISTIPNGGGVSAGHDIEIIDGNAVGVGISPVESTLERGGTVEVNAVLLNAYGAVVTANEDTSVRVSASETAIEFALPGGNIWAPTLEVTVPAGQLQAPLLVKTDNAYVGTATLNAVAVESQSLVGGTAKLDVVMGDIANVAFVTPELTTVATHPSQTMVIEAQNRWGSEVMVSKDTRFYVRTTSPDGTFADSKEGPWGVNFVSMSVGQSQAEFVYRSDEPGVHNLTVLDNIAAQPGDLILSAQQPHAIVAQEFSHFIVTNISSPTQTGIASSVVVFAVDSENYVVAGYDGTVSFSSDDSGAVLPLGSYTFKPSVDRGIHTFTNGVGFKTPGVKSVTANDSEGGQGTQYDIVVVNGNSAPVRSITFSGITNDKLTLDINEPSNRLMLNLRDQAGALTNAPAGGLPIMVTTGSATGEFSTDGTTWRSQAAVTVEEGLSFLTTPLFYRDSSPGKATITATDWIGAEDGPLISNAAIEVIVNSLSTDVQLSVKTLNYAGNYTSNPYLFSRNGAGDISGKVNVEATASYDGQLVPASWVIDVNGKQTSHSSQATVAQESDVSGIKAGASNLPVDVRANDGKRESYWQGQVAVSPWIASLNDVAFVDGHIQGSLVTYSDGALADSLQGSLAIYYKTTGRSVALYEVHSLMSAGMAEKTETGKIKFTIPVSLANGEYEVVTNLWDGIGVTAQDSSSLDINEAEAPVEPEAPVIPGIPTGPVPPVGPVAPGGGLGGPTGEIEDIPSVGDKPGAVAPAEPGLEPVEPPLSGDSGGRVSEFIMGILRSPETPVRTAQAALGVIAAIVGILLYQLYREWRHARFLVAVIRRNNKVIADKEAFLQLAAHHLRTPLTLLSMGSDLLRAVQSSRATLADQLATVTQRLKVNAESIIASIEDSSKSAPIIASTNVSVAKRKLYLSPIFWLPVVLSVVVTVAMNIAIYTIGQRDVSGATMMTQASLILLGAIALYVVVRMKYQQNERSTALKQSEQQIAALSKAKNDFVHQVATMFTDDIESVSSMVSGVDGSVAAASPLAEGSERLRRIVQRFKVIDAVYASRVGTHSVAVDDVIKDALRGVNPEELRVNSAVEPSSKASLRRSSWMLSRLLRDVFTSMTPLAGQGLVKVESKTSRDATTITITGPRSHDKPAEDLFSVYTRSGDEASGSFSVTDQDNRMHRLDLYLDRLIASELDADLTIDRGGSQMKVSLILPRA